MSSSAVSPSRSRVSVWLKRSLVTLLVLANLGVFYVYWQLRSIEVAVQDSAQTVSDVVPQLTPTLPDSTEPLVFLLVGSDSRANLENADDFGNFEGQRSDVIMLVKIDADDGRAQLLSLPRDLWVEIPDNGTQKINAAYSLGGAPLLIQTVTGFTGIDINHYVEVDFAGFLAIVDELGGVVIDFAYPARDVKSGLDVEAGEQLLNGEQALAFARSRSYQEYQDGRWVSVEADDFGRTHRQQDLITAILERMKRPSTITEAGSLVRAFSEHLTIDAALADSSLIELAFRMRTLRGGDIESVTLPGVTDTVGSLSVVLPKQPEADAVLEAFQRGDSLAIAAGETDPFTLMVLNGNGFAESAGRWSDVLDEAGFFVDEVSTAERSDYLETLVTVRDGEEERGQEIIAALGFGRLEPGDVPDDVDAVVVLGADAAGTAG